MTALLFSLQYDQWHLPVQNKLKKLEYCNVNNASYWENILISHKAFIQTIFLSIYEKNFHYSLLSFTLLIYFSSIFNLRLFILFTLVFYLLKFNFVFFFFFILICIYSLKNIDHTKKSTTALLLNTVIFHFLILLFGT